MRRCAMLDTAKAAGGPATVSEVMRLLVESSLPPVSPPWSNCYSRFIVMLQLADTSRDHPTWRDPGTLDNAIRALSAMIDPK